MLKVPDHATLLVKRDKEDPTIQVSGWTFKGHDFLLADMDEIMKSKNIGGSIFWFILLLLAMLAIFDTQVLSIFRRQKEIGTYIALGMTKRQVVGLFTVEGAFHSILAIFVGAIYGIPLFIWQANTGIRFPMEADDYGLAMAEVMYPAYSLALVVGTILVVVIATIIVSYLPSRKISKMKPTEALRGKLQ
jgi:ABC-type antimicrobial peptide transport system permease subunit